MRCRLPGVHAGSQKSTSVAGFYCKVCSSKKPWGALPESHEAWVVPTSWYRLAAHTSLPGNKNIPRTLTPFDTRMKLTLHVHAMAMLSIRTWDNHGRHKTNALMTSAVGRT